MISIIIPTYKEVKNIALISHAVHSELFRKNLEYEIIFVDDNSSDGTKELCTRLSKKLPVKLVIRRQERGLSSAVIKGFCCAQGDILVVMDADMSHPPEAVADMVQLLKTRKADFVVGSRYVKGGSIEKDWSFFRHINSIAAKLLAMPLVKIKDPMAVFFALRKKDLPKLSMLKPVGYKIGFEVIVKGGFDKIIEVPIHFSNRRFGKSKLNFKEQVLYLGHIVCLYCFVLRQL